jgi:hypothetical protein
MPSVKADPKEAIAQWQADGGEQVLFVTTGATGELAIGELSANLTDIIRKRRQDGAKLIRIRLDFEARRDRDRKSTEKRASFDPEAKGLELVEKAKDAEGGAWSGSELQQRFKLSPANLHRRRKEHRIIYWRDARHAFFYPKWQFTGTGAVQPGIEEILGVFKSSDEWRIMNYFLTPRYQLEGKRPLDLVRAGDVETVLSHARTHAEEGSW